MIRVQNLSKHFGSVRAVDRVSFAIETGEIVGFIGPNGAGKSTTMRILTGYLAGDRGRVEVMGFDVARQALEVQRRVGYLPESNPLYTDMRVGAFLRFVSQVRGIPRSQRSMAIERAVDLCAIGPVVRKRIRELSKGYRQRVGLAQAVIHRPSVLVLDEPTEGLDPNQRVVMRTLIQSFAEEGATVILSTHILPEVELTCPRALMISAGRIVADGVPAEITAGQASFEEAFREITVTQE